MPRNAYAPSRNRGRRPSRGGFSLIELVIVVVIIGIIAAIAIPRMSRGSEGAAESALASNLSALRSAIDLYKLDHGSYPPAASFEDCMTKYSNATGTNWSATKTSTEIYGPYLRAIPPLPVGDDAKGQKGVAALAGSAVGWVYNAAEGDIRANSSKTGTNGTPYNQW